jgi:hypothetical protein
MPKDEFDPEDPLELKGVTFPDGDADEMARCFVEEYIQLGFDDATIWSLFRSPFFAGMHDILEKRGEPWVDAVIRECRDRLGYWKMRTVRGSDRHA